MKADPERLEKHVVTLAEDLAPRDAGHPANMERVATYIGDQFRTFAHRVEEQPYAVDGMTVRNVRAFFDAGSEERIILGAHYDVAGPYPGADDNASGVAGLLELARLLSTEKLPMTVELVSYPLEEPPYFYTRNMGSFVHAKSLKDQGENVRAMLALEMIGYFRDEEDSQLLPAFPAASVLSLQRELCSCGGKIISAHVG
ncbi:MAG: M28 family peptidase [Balneolaceae bacterium]|nr:M28 family peptidase [Balneolaceae bacterium]